LVRYRIPRGFRLGFGSRRFQAAKSKTVNDACARTSKLVIGPTTSAGVKPGRGGNAMPKAFRLRVKFCPVIAASTFGSSEARACAWRALACAIASRAN